VGELVASGDNIMQGYWKDPKATERVLRPEGLHTGDLAWLDDEGFVYLVGRSSDMIKSGAHRIDPLEIEMEIKKHDGIVDAAVVGKPDEFLGEVPVAFIVPNGESRDDLQRAVIQQCRTNLPRHKQVRHVYIVQQLPRTASGKLKRTELRDFTCDTANQLDAV